MAATEAEAAEAASAATGGAQHATGIPGAPDAQLPAEIFWNIPNTLTVLRILVVPVMLLLPFYQGVTMSRVLAWAFIAAALTDILDGYLARRGSQVTRIGKLLDPLADKLLVSTVLIMCLTVGRIPDWCSWMVVVIVGRELAVTGLRGIASSQGHVVGASWQGKMKTLAQNIAAGALLFHYPVYGLPANEIGLTLLGLATLLTIWSGYTYFANYFGWRQLGG